ncbi:hypothetical protein BOW53_12130 [Solemya pervernicosa gill symbiont]|uniref:Inner membrane protein YgaP-like transmembrane domain-containing protein n=2 Tax=Gammaproteobacteria incertae sedis TaxID=118884 RepID=A0A1T2L2J6_9GAMM|nr:DUF2892 domain-containing protein [Candidatus Reidiella endopervernicosa]OOZ39302.1 hypothetical protein BOW53_12130 [Solemya pervernicosa gill symbiont]QKQ25516.1 DUF2892 domain-containing protein [Candidatus Reidiella endopervernicosa]
MKMNVGSLDKVARLAIGIILIALAMSGTIGIWGWIGVVPIITALVGWCPFYHIVGINSCPHGGHCT